MKSMHDLAGRAQLHDPVANVDDVGEPNFVEALGHPQTTLAAHHFGLLLNSAIALGLSSCVRVEQPTEVYVAAALDATAAIHSANAAAF
jgi:hypothetical protein